MFSSFFLTISIISSIVFVIIGIYEVNKSEKINKSEKTMWIISFIFMSFITGLLYFIIGRKRIKS
ncbi:PLDc N-terminal domain-containing protein [Flavobacterium sp.]|uniref:PLDc N-terminal domain-containing protein n=1 Tax=Flavobacterium sp. TaxID=239 RepID=UPI0037C105CD